MKVNIGGIDKVLRITGGIVLIGLVTTDMIGAWGWVGIVPLATGLINWCPLYTIAGINTGSSKPEASEV